MADRSLKTQIRRLLPKSMRPHRILRGRLRGFWIVTSWHDYPAAILGRTERPLLEWFEQNVSIGETWLDIGAHYGYTAIALSRLVGATGRVFAFEPEIATCGHLARTRVLNRLEQLQVLPCGLGSPDGMAIGRLPVVRGMLDRTLESEGRGTETFLVAQLDWLWSRISEGQPQVHGVKIDVQGMEIAVLKGMVRLLSEFKPTIVLEVHRGVDRNELLEVIGSVGYSTAARPVDPVTGEREALFLDDRSYCFSATTKGPASQ